MTAPMLELREVRKYFPVGTGAFLQRKTAWVKAVEGISFAIAAGETLGSIVVRAVAIVVHARRRIERARRRQLCKRAGREIERKTISERQDRSMSLIDYARSAFNLTQPREDA